MFDLRGNSSYRRNMTPKNQKQLGFSIVAVLVILTILTTILGGWLVWSRNNKEPSNNHQADVSSSEPTINENPAEAWVEYRNQPARIKFEHPKSWENLPGIVQAFDDGQLGEVSGILRSPSGSELEWHYTIWGGKGGYCQPDPGDVSFAEGNNCSSKHIYDVAVLPEMSIKQNILLDASARLALTKTKYKSDSSSPVKYQICLDDFDRSDGPPKKGTTMGLLFACEYWSTGFNMKFEVPDEAAFDTQEAKIAEQIMRSLDTF